MSLITCSECGKEVSSKAVACPNCGSPIASQKYCKYCGEQIDNKCIICPKCGKQIEEFYNTDRNIIINNNSSASASTSSTANNAHYHHGKPKNKWISLLLCIFTVFGHKFYEGKIGMGILYFLTIGLFGIGWLIDIFILLFKPNPYYV